MPVKGTATPSPIDKLLRDALEKGFTAVATEWLVYRTIFIEREPAVGSLCLDGSWCCPLLAVCITKLVQIRPASLEDEELARDRETLGRCFS